MTGRVRNQERKKQLNKNGPPPLLKTSYALAKLKTHMYSSARLKSYPLNQNSSQTFQNGGKLFLFQPSAHRLNLLDLIVVEIHLTKINNLICLIIH